MKKDKSFMQKASRIKKKIPGATMISCFLVRIRKKVKSLVGSSSLTTLQALSASWLIRPAYCTVVALSKVDLIGMPRKYLGITS